jgi:hypothetical protein
MINNDDGDRVVTPFVCPCLVNACRAMEERVLDASPRDWDMKLCKLRLSGNETRHLYWLKSISSSAAGMRVWRHEVLDKVLAGESVLGLTPDKGQGSLCVKGFGVSSLIDGSSEMFQASSVATLAILKPREGCINVGAGRSRTAVFRLLPAALESSGLPDEAGWEVTTRLRQSSDIQNAVDSISESSWELDMQTLSSWSRFYDASSPNVDVSAAMNWLRSELEQVLALAPTSANASVSLQQVSVPGATVPAWNVVGEILGSRNSSQLVVVGGHYDSTAGSSGASAPGAEDNASGSIGVLHIARALMSNYAELCHTSMKFVLFAAEESGLHGSRAFVNDLMSQPNAPYLIGAHTTDMAAYWDPASPSPKVLIESLPIWESLFFPLYSAAASTYGTKGLSTAWSGSPFGSDHMPFLDRGLPALLVIDNDWASYPFYHKSTDVFPGVLNATIACDILRMSVGAISHLMRGEAVSTSGGTISGSTTTSQVSTSGGTISGSTTISQVSSSGTTLLVSGGTTTTTTTARATTTESSASKHFAVAATALLGLFLSV